MYPWCAPQNGDAAPALDGEVTSHRIKIKRGEYLYRVGDAFRSLYAIRSGSFKTQQVLRQGKEKVTGFFLTGELMGVDAIASEAHNDDAVALEDSTVCVVPFAKFEDFTRQRPPLQRRLNKLISAEILRNPGTHLHGKLSAAQRLAGFLLWLSQRQQACGYSGSSFVLRMKRSDIGDYLGLTAETVTRVLTRLTRQGVVLVRNRHVQLRDLAALQRLAMT